MHNFISGTRKVGPDLATAMTDRVFIEAVAAEMSDGIHCAVNFWMELIEEALADPRLTTLGRLKAVQEIVEQHRRALDQNPGDQHGYVA